MNACYNKESDPEEFLIVRQVYFIISLKHTKSAANNNSENYTL